MAVPGCGSAVRSDVPSDVRRSDVPSDVPSVVRSAGIGVGSVGSDVAVVAVM